MSRMLRERLVKATRDLSEIDRATDEANTRLVDGRLQAVAARAELLQCLEGASRRLTIPTYTRAILQFARTAGYPEREVSTRDIKLVDWDDAPTLPGASVTAKLTCVGKARDVAPHPLQGGQLKTGP